MTFTQMTNIEQNGRPDQATLIRTALTLPELAISYHVGERLQQLFPGSGLIKTSDTDFGLESYAGAGFCRITPSPALFNQFATSWYGPTHTVYTEVEHVWFAVEWEGHNLNVLALHLPCGYGATRVSWIIAANPALAEAFFRAVCTWNTPIREEVMVFQDGYWSRSRELYLAIKGATLDNLVLPGSLKQEIHADLANFFNARATYDRYGVPWKRGVILIGPPGNGKTHAVKALINALDQPCLYVKSFATEQGTSDQHSIRSVFEQAREVTPCILVLEDLDALVHDRNRSFFLNELDGFAANVGIVTLATTNHPERLDPAIINRPSRFDRKYHFPLPAYAERRTYLEMWNATLQAELRLSEAGMGNVATLTEGFSFAYLKELIISATMGWIATLEAGAMDQVMAAQADLLHEQMTTATEPEDAPFG